MFRGFSRSLLLVEEFPPQPGHHDDADEDRRGGPERAQDQDERPRQERPKDRADEGEETGQELQIGLHGLGQERPDRQSAGGESRDEADNVDDV